MDLSQEYDLCPSGFLVVRDTFEFVVGFLLVRDKHDRNLLFLKRRCEIAIKPVRRFHENLGPGWHGPDIASKNEARTTEQYHERNSLFHVFLLKSVVSTLQAGVLLGIYRRLLYVLCTVY